MKRNVERERERERRRETEGEREREREDVRDKRGGIVLTGRKVQNC
jgi:hypothetical protein